MNQRRVTRGVGCGRENQKRKEERKKNEGEKVIIGSLRGKCEGAVTGMRLKGACQVHMRVKTKRKEGEKKDRAPRAPHPLHTRYQKRGHYFGKTPVDVSLTPSMASRPVAHVLGKRATVSDAGCDRVVEHRGLTR